MVYCVAFPRSGHHLLVTALARYCSGDLAFDSRSFETGLDRGRFEAGPLAYCEFYNCCRQVPCKFRDTNLQKNHDLDLSLELGRQDKCIVQYREPIPAIISNFKLQLAYQRKHYKPAFWAWFVPKGSKKLLETRSCWQSFFDEQYSYYLAFLDKWVTSATGNPARLVVTYEELLAAPSVKLKRALEFIPLVSRIDLGRVEAVVDSLFLEDKKSYLDFPFYNQVELEESMQRILTESRGN